MFFLLCFMPFLRIRTTFFFFFSLLLCSQGLSLFTTASLDELTVIITFTFPTPSTCFNALTNRLSCFFTQRSVESSFAVVSVLCAFFFVFPDGMLTMIRLMPRSKIRQSFGMPIFSIRCCSFSLSIIFLLLTYIYIRFLHIIEV